MKLLCNSIITPLIKKSGGRHHLLAAIVHHEQQVGAVSHGEGESVLERVGAVVVVADTVLVDVVHGETASLAVVLAVAGALDGTMARSLDHGEDNGLRLWEKATQNDDDDDDADDEDDADNDDDPTSVSASVAFSSNSVMVFLTPSWTLMPGTWSSGRESSTGLIVM